MRRRDFLKALSGAAMAPLVWPNDALAQQARPSTTIGFLGATTPTIWSANVTAFQNRLRELDWIDGRNVSIEYRWAQGRDDRYAEFASEFVQRKVDIIVDPPPLKWSDLRYVSDIQEDYNGKEALQA